LDHSDPHRLAAAVIFGHLLSPLSIVAAQNRGREVQLSLQERQDLSTGQCAGEDAP